jgi:hypothetical protein
MGCARLRRAFWSLAWVAVFAPRGAAAASGSAPSPASDSPQRPRVTIRGSGRDVRIEGAVAPRARIARNEEDLGAELIRLHQSGFPEETLVAYLQAHRSAIPTVLSGDEYARLRRAGIGERTLRYVGSIAAIDVGPTGESGVTVAASAPPQREMEPAANELGYPFYGDYGGGYGVSGATPFRFGLRHGRLRSPRSVRIPGALRPFPDRRFVRMPSRSIGGRTVGRLPRLP